MNWSDLPAFLAVAQLGSLRQAADMLDVTQPTIARRIQTLEADLGIPLFERDREGHRLTAAGAQLLPEVRAVETAALRVQQRSLGLVGRLTETVRVEAGETAAAVLARGLKDIAEGPNIELLVTGLPSSGTGRSPEILVQHGLPDAGSGLTRRAGSISCALYGVAAFAEGRTLPLAPRDLSTLPWLGFVEEQEHYVTMRWLRTQMRDRPPAARLMNINLMTVAATEGIGVAVLPVFLGNSLPGLVRLSAPIEELRADYWTITHPDLSRNTSVRTVINWIINCFQTSGHKPDDGR
ncbi:LysR family transcriptional regulator [Pelagibius sp. Alg239-R121]|uniref:LysR family transcriptional regulator n=1 Tax=Pelagibius sp. Alg239-R121 TaxID=2993448 RepID=UPI0024A690B6|nr:LysR family transcriptional regulator [Pelagibius sp. Alg239-R121]